MVFGIQELVSVNVIPPPLPNTPVGTDTQRHTSAQSLEGQALPRGVMSTGEKAAYGRSHLTRKPGRNGY